MSGRIEPVSVLMCDDIRYELDGGYSLMGVATPLLEVSAFPVRRRIWFALVMNTVAEGTIKFETRVRWKDEVKWSAEHEIFIEVEERGALLPIPGPYAGYDEAGELVFEFVTDGEATEVQRWSVMALSDAAGSKPSPPPASNAKSTKRKKNKN